MWSLWGRGIFTTIALMKVVDHGNLLLLMPPVLLLLLLLYAMSLLAVTR